MADTSNTLNAPAKSARIALRLEPELAQVLEGLRESRHETLSSVLRRVIADAGRSRVTAA